MPKKNDPKNTVFKIKIDGVNLKPDQKKALVKALADFVKTTVNTSLPQGASRLGDDGVYACSLEEWRDEDNEKNKK